MRFSFLRAIAGLLALSAQLPAQQYIVHAYRQADGLKNLGVRSLATDCEGFLWVATENGVYRFLGSGFEHFGAEQGIAERGIQEILVDGSCTLWVGTTQNLYRLHGRHFLPAGQTPIRLQNAHDLAVEDDHHLLVVDDGHLFRLSHDAHGQMLSYSPAIPAGLEQQHPDLGHVTSISVAGENRESRHIWIGAGARLYSSPAGADGVPNGLIAQALTEWNQVQGLPEDHWESVVVDHSGVVWAEGWTHIATLPNPASQDSGPARFVDRSLPVSAQGSFFLRSRLVVDKDGRVLAPTDEGVARWNGNRWQLINRENGLPRNNQISAMLVGPAGDLWLGSYGDGLYNWAGYQQWEGWADDKRLPSLIVWAIDSSRPGRVIAGTDKGPAWVDPATGASGPLIKDRVWAPGLIVSMGRRQDGSLWAATNSGSLLSINDKTGQTAETGKVPASILTAVEDSTGRLLIGTDHGIFEREPGTSSPLQPVASANALIESGDWVNAACQAPGGVNWFLAGNSLLREQNGQWAKPAIPGLPGKRAGRLIALTCARDGSLWATGQRIGVWRLTPAGDVLKPWHLEPPAELRGIDSYVILADRRGWLWMGTDQGILAWNGSAWRHFTQESGLLWNDIDEWGLNESPDGSLWIGTSGGLAHLLHPERAFNSLILPVALTAIDRGPQAMQNLSQVDLAWSPLPLRFQLSSPLVRNRSDLIFKYQVEGLHSGWIESRDGVAILSGIAPGSYTFLAMATNPGLNASSPVLRIRLVIRPPWWRKPWFLILAAILLIALLAVAIRVYASHLRARSLHLEALVRLRTRELEDSREQLRIQATYDGLTGMLNRSAILSELDAQMDRARDKGAALILALTDIDHFKNVNDAYGHLVGDEALRRFATALRTAVRAYDSVGRYGGEEFLVVLADIPYDLADSRLSRLHDAVSNLQLRVQDAEIALTCSIGATIFDPLHESADAELLLSIADRALYAAKAEGRNRVAFTRRESTVPASGASEQEADENMAQP